MNKILQFFTNRFVLVTLFFLSWIFFFASNDVVSQYKQNEEYKQMKEKLQYLEKEIAAMKQQRQALTQDSSVIEKVARERYRMKKPNEEIFVFDTLK